MKRNIKNFIVLCISLFLFSSCLTVEKKEYHFELTGEESGILTIKYINIMSVGEKGENLENDFKELIDQYIEGDLIERDYPFASLLSKRLFEENGVLCGEVRLCFSELSAVKLFQYKKDQAKMLNLNPQSGIEKYVDSNGNYGGDIMPVVFWDDEISDLYLNTMITSPDNTSESLLQMFKEWESTQQETNAYLQLQNPDNPIH